MPIAGEVGNIRAAVMTRVVAAVDRVFARSLRLSPMKAGVSDPDRPQHEFSGLLRVAVGDDQAPKGGGGKTWSNTVAAGPATVSIDRRTYTGPAIRQGDRIRDLTMVDAVYEVSRIDDRDDNRLVIEVTEL